MGAITHPTGTVYSADKNNFAPRLGMSWNFKPKFVFRGSFGMFTQDVMPQLGQQEYTAQAAVQQPAGNPYPAFYLSQGPGPISYNTILPTVPPPSSAPTTAAAAPLTSIRTCAVLTP